MSRPREEWLHDCATRYRALEQFSQEEARLQFLRILRSLPYGAPAAHPHLTACMEALTAAPSLQGHCTTARGLRC